MRIISKSTLIDYYTRVPQSKTALEEWYEKAKKSEWTCFADIKKTFNSVDAVGNRIWHRLRTRLPIVQH